MSWKPARRELIRSAVAGGALCAGCSQSRTGGPQAADHDGLPRVAGLVSPGCRGTRVRVARVYAGVPKGLWPTPNMDLEAEKNRYDALMSAQRELADVEFVGNDLVTSVEPAGAAAETARTADGVLVIHLSMGIGAMLKEFLSANRPTMLFAAPYSGHEWTGYGAIEKENPLFDCMLTSDAAQLAAAVRPFRAAHHLREARILNVTGRPWAEEATGRIRDRFGTQFVVIDLERMLKAYEAVPIERAEAEAARWISGAVALVEPDRDEVVRSCRLALAFERLMDEERATVITTDCYGSMYHKLPAFPCVGNTRLNDMGLGGICESDLNSAMTHIVLQGLVGRPGFISDPTMDESKDAIILAHCLGSRKMDGPGGPNAPYKLRTIMERQEGCVPQVFMRVGEPVTQAILLGGQELRYFTGSVLDVPDSERGCRTKITVRINGSARRLWENWSHGLHRVTCYGNVEPDLQRFCRFNRIPMVNEAV